MKYLIIVVITLSLITVNKQRKPADFKTKPTSDELNGIYLPEL